MTHTPTEIAAMIDDLECIDRGGVLHAKRPKQPHPICDKAAAMLRDVAAERDALARDKLEILLPPGAVTGDFMDGWVSGQQHMIFIYDGEQAVDGAVKITERLEVAEAERDRLAAMVEKLIDYAEHGKRCPQYSVWDGTCTCGLSDVLEESENGQ